MKRLVLITGMLLVLSLTACINYRVGNDVDNPTVMAAKTGKDCTVMIFGLGFEPSRSQAMRSAGITKIRASYDTNMSLLGIGRYCHAVVGE